MSVSSVAGIASPLFFGAVYALSVGEGAAIPFIGTAFLIAAVLLGGAFLGAATTRRAVSIAPAD
jgi:DHA1 family tetracycline resistance protein-like MFS transporter